MSTLSIRLPDSLHQAVKQASNEDHVSINQFIMLAVTERVSALQLAKRLEARANRVARKDFLEVLKKVPSTRPEPEDEL